MLLASGIFKIGCAPVCGWIRQIVPRAGLLGSLTAIALVLISFLPLLDIAAQPVAGMVALGLMLATLTARWQFPKQFPGALGAVVAGCLVCYAQWSGWGEGVTRGLVLHWWCERCCPCRSGMVDWFEQSWRRRLSPGGHSVALSDGGRRHRLHGERGAGDDYPTGQIIAVGAGTLCGGLFGGVIQSTPIGHPAYKAMGARSAYTLATPCS